MWWKFSGNGHLPFGQCNLHHWRRDETKKVAGSHPLLVLQSPNASPKHSAVHNFSWCLGPHLDLCVVWWQPPGVAARTLTLRGFLTLRARQQQQTPTVLVDDSPTIPSFLLLPPAPPPSPLPPPSPPRRAVLPVGCNHGAVGEHRTHTGGSV